MSDLTVQERVLQAVNTVYALIAERQAATAAVQTAKQAEDAVRLSGTVEVVTEEAVLVRDTAISKAAAASKPGMNAALADVQKAQAKYNLILTKQREAEAKASAEYDKSIEQAQQEQDARMTTAHATVVRNEQQVAVIQTAIDQHKRQVKDNFGIDLGKLVV